MLKIDPELAGLSEADLVELRDSMYEMARLAFDVYWTKKHGFKNPIAILPSTKEKGTI